MKRQKIVRTINDKLSKRFNDFESVFTEALQNCEIKRTKPILASTLDASRRQRLVSKQQIREFRTTTLSKTNRKTNKTLEAKRIVSMKNDNQQFSFSPKLRSRASSLGLKTVIKQTKSASKEMYCGSMRQFSNNKIQKTNSFDITMLRYEQIIRHMCTSWRKFSLESTPEQIYNYFKLVNKFKAIQKPSIKKYTNCVYFGQRYRDKTCKYQGFLYFCGKKKIYYGNFMEEVQHGRGVEINLVKSTVFRGDFCNGEKTGLFQVLKDQEQYQGRLRNGKYEGFGILETPDIRYQGYFYKGEKHGWGKQYIKSISYLRSGTFYHGEFIQDQLSSEQSTSMILSDTEFKFQNNFKAGHQFINKLPKFTYPLQFLKIQNTILQSASEDDPLTMKYRFSSPFKQFDQ